MLTTSQLTAGLWGC